MTAKTITIKRGASLNYSGQILENGVAKNISNHTITSQIRDDANTLIDYFDITVTSAVNGEYEAVPHAGTSSYPIGKLKFDIKLVDSIDNSVVYTETGILNVVLSITA